jgi:hypothetical protein
MTRDSKLPHKIAIAGPGRSGTSLLVKLLKAVGFGTPDDDSKSTGVHAGLESRIGFASPYEVDKDPWLFEYAAKISDEDWGQYRVLIVPIRNLDESSVSRSKNERVARVIAAPESDHWSWDVGGNSAGASLSRIDAAAVAGVLAEGLWTVLEVASSKKVPILLLHFPTFARDRDYLWGRLAPFIENRVSREDFEEAFSRVVDPSLLADDKPNDDSGPGKAELVRMVDDLRERFVAAGRDRAEWENERAGWENERLLLGSEIRSLETRISSLQSEIDKSNNEQSLVDAVESTNRELLARHNDLILSIAHDNARTDSRLAELAAQLAVVNARLEHLFIVTERAAQPLYRKIGRVLRRLFSRGPTQ